ncbi:MAG TPA: Mov34/MPN/PAD-1 family protein, partial [Anaeromyxobacteraceae bacterium]|nr:Mov34/MPN/PAD-1 family protein [Anaeromyxobacteraceae bacterium]
MVKIDEKEYEELRRHGEETYPHESCGVLLGCGEGDERVVVRIARCENVRVDSLRDRYRIDGRE